MRLLELVLAKQLIPLVPKMLSTRIIEEPDYFKESCSFSRKQASFTLLKIAIFGEIPLSLSGNDSPGDTNLESCIIKDKYDHFGGVIGKLIIDYSKSISVRLFFTNFINILGDGITLMRIDPARLKADYLSESPITAEAIEHGVYVAETVIYQKKAPGKNGVLITLDRLRIIFNGLLFEVKHPKELKVYSDEEASYEIDVLFDNGDQLDQVVTLPVSFSSDEKDLFKSLVERLFK